MEKMEQKIVDIITSFTQQHKKAIKQILNRPPIIAHKEAILPDDYSWCLKQIRQTVTLFINYINVELKGNFNRSYSDASEFRDTLNESSKGLSEQIQSFDQLLLAIESFSADEEEEHMILTQFRQIVRNFLTDTLLFLDEIEQTVVGGDLQGHITFTAECDEQTLIYLFEKIKKRQDLADKEKFSDRNMGCVWWIIAIALVMYFF